MPSINIVIDAGLLPNAQDLNTIIVDDDVQSLIVLCRHLKATVLGDHLKSGHLWSLQNRPLWMA
jgi:hypothetical protein